MSTTTTNYGLIKPDTTDPILIGQLNDNSDAIDAALKENADAIENKPDAADIPSPSTAAPAMDGTAAAGTSTDYARADHIHPSDTSKQDALTTAQLAAVNSGIDSAKVEQIETNENNILFTATIGKCESTSNTANKVVTVSDVNYTPHKGSIIAVKFKYGNNVTDTVEHPITLNVNNTGAYRIWYKNGDYANASQGKIFGLSGYYIYYMYDGVDRWVWINYCMDSTYSLMSQTEASAGTATNERLISAKVLSDTIDEKLAPVENNISSKQDALTTAQLDAVNSGIDSAKVTQIETNKNNILTAYGGIPNKNKFNIYNLFDINNLTVNEATGVCTQVTNDTRANLMFGIWKVSSTVVSPTTITANGIYHFSFKKSAGDTTIRFGHNGATRNAQITYDISDFDNGTYILQLNIINCEQANGKYSWNQVMICSQADYTADPSYQPYAMSNAELTAQWSSKQVSKWATSFSVPNPSFGQGELIKLYVYGGNPASLAMYLITSNTVVPLTSTTGISYTIQTNTSVDFTTTSTCLAYYEYIRFATS